MFSPPSVGLAQPAVGGGGGAKHGGSLLGGGPLASAVGDGLAPKYSAIAGDGGAAGRAREAAMLFSAAEGALEEGDAAGALQKADDAVALFRALNDSAGVADSLRVLVGARAQLGDRAAAMRTIEEELETFRTKGDKRGEASMLLSSAEVAASTIPGVSYAESERAVQSALDAREIFRSLGDQKMEAACLTALATAFVRSRPKPQQLRECKRAYAAGQEALSIMRPIKDRRGEAKALHAMAVTCSRQGDNMLTDALRHAREALAIWRELGERRCEALELHAIAQLQLQDKRHDDAAESAQEAATILQEVKGGRGQGHEAGVLSTLVAALVEKKDFEQAVRAAERKVAHFQADDDPISEAMAMEILSSAHLANQEYTEALNTVQKALMVVRDISKRTRRTQQLEAGLLHTLADIHLADGRSDKAEEEMEEALKILKEIQDNDGMIRAYCTLSYISMNLGEWRDAIRAASDSRDAARLEEDRLQEGVALLALCCAHSSKGGKGDVRRALNIAKEAQEIFEEEEHKRAEASAWYLLSNAQIMSQDYDKAIAAAKRAQALFREAECQEDEVNLGLLVAHAHFYAALAEGAPDIGTKPSELWQKTLKAAEDALALSKRKGDESQVGKCLLGVAQVYVMTKHARECQEHLDEAIALSQKIGNESAEAYAWTLNAQMYWALKQLDKCTEPAQRAAELFRKVGDVDGEDLALEMTRLTADGAMVEPPPRAAVGDEASGAEVKEYDGPTEDMLLATVNEVAFSLIGNESLSGDTPLMDAGLDSLASVEFQNTLAKEFAGVQLPSTLVFDFPTPKQISDFIFTGLKEAWAKGKR